MTHPVSVPVVDDEPLLRIFAADFLADAGFMVNEASTADEAIEVIGSRPDIVAVSQTFKCLVPWTASPWHGKSNATGLAFS
jgi:hypothetical protein